MEENSQSYQEHIERGIILGSIRLAIPHQGQIGESQISSAYLDFAEDPPLVLKLIILLNEYVLVVREIERLEGVPPWGPLPPPGPLLWRPLGEVEEIPLFTDLKKVHMSIS